MWLAYGWSTTRTSRRVDGSARRASIAYAGDVRVAVRVGVVHVQMASVRREGQTQEPLLAAERHLVREIDDGHRIHGPPSRIATTLPVFSAT